MNLDEALQKVYNDLSKDDKTELRNEMTDFYRLKEALDRAQISDDILRYLVVELHEDRRNSFISRILGRYTKMLTQEIKEDVHSWANRKRK